MTSRIEDLYRRRTKLRQGGGESRLRRQHDAGKLSARERLALLIDPDTFQENFLFSRHNASHFGMAKRELPGEGAVTGYGTVDGRPVCVASQDFTVAGGSVGGATARKIAETMRVALQTGAPFVFINDGAGARIQEGVDALSGYGQIFFKNVQLSGVVPKISVIAGPCAGGAAYSPALTDFIIQVKDTGQLFITGPKVIQQVTGEQVDDNQLGGAQVHTQLSGVVHFRAEDDRHALEITRRLLSFLPSNNTETAPFRPDLAQDVVIDDPVLDTIVPEDPTRPYNVIEVITRLVDAGDFLEIQADYAGSIVVGLGRLEGHTVGVVANQPCVRAGVLDIDSSTKAARFIRFCNAFNIPLVTLVDVPGFLPGVAQEHRGIIRHDAKMLFAYAAATVPKLTVVLRKAYGGAYLAMCSADLGADHVLAWPTAEIAVMGAAGAVGVLYRKEIAAADDPAAERQARTQEYEEAFANPYEAAARGLVHDVIAPSETRAALASALAFLRSKRELRPEKKHGLIPL